MATYVLVHGAWRGGWCWTRVRERLHAEGHSVFTPTLTGLGERSHLLAKDVRLKTHIADVLNLIRWEELHDVVLCGHSYGGVVATGVAEAMPERIASLIYLDAFLPASGQSLHDMLPPEAADAQKADARSQGDGWRLPPPPASYFAVNAADRAWVDRQCTPHPLATFTDSIIYSDRARSVADTRYIFASEWPDTVFVASEEEARRRGWLVTAIATGHDVMLDDPAGLAKMLR